MAVFKTFILFVIFFVFSIVHAIPTAELNKVSTKQDSTSEPCVICCRFQRNLDRHLNNVRMAQEALEDAGEAHRTSQEEMTAVRAEEDRVDDQIGRLRAQSRTNRALMLALQVDIEEAEESSGLLEFLEALQRGVRRDNAQIRREMRSLNGERRELIVAIEEANDDLRNSRDAQRDAQRRVNRAGKRMRNAERNLRRCLEASTPTSTPETPADTSSEMPPATGPEMPAETSSEMPAEIEPETSPEM